MLTLVIGGSGSGKSSYAEDLLSNYVEKKYYLATMQIYGEEGQAKVDRHRKMREGKNFITLEYCRDIRNAIKELPEDGSGVVLLECMSNLVANEMFVEDIKRDSEEVVPKILGDIEALNAAARELVIITNNVAEDGVKYDEATMDYIKAISDINVKISDVADKVIEVVVGIPLTIKE